MVRVGHEIRIFFICASLTATNKSLKLYYCRNELDSKELFDMARKLQGRKDPERESKANDAIKWMKEMINKPHLASIFASRNQCNVYLEVTAICTKKTVVTLDHYHNVL